MSREAARERARSIAASVAQLSGQLADPALMGYPIAVLCNPLQRPPLPPKTLRSASEVESSAPLVEARSATPYKE
jgi:hypothetical protein